MDFNPPSSADFAWSDAQSALTGNQDQIVIAGWLHSRMVQIERALALSVPPFPELPSRIHGPGCIPKRSDAVTAALKSMMEQTNG